MSGSMAVLLPNYWNIAESSQDKPRSQRWVISAPKIGVNRGGFFRHRITCMFLENWWTWWYTIDMFMRLSSFTCFFDLLIRIIPLTIVHMQVPFGFVQSKDILKFQDWSLSFLHFILTFQGNRALSEAIKDTPLLIDYRRLYYMGIPGLLWIVTLTTLW